MADHYVITIKGGPGSGHHGHAGVPGQLGGSAPGGGVGFGISVATSGGYTRADEGCELITDCSGLDELDDSYLEWTNARIDDGSAYDIVDYTTTHSLELNDNLRKGNEDEIEQSEYLGDTMSGIDHALGKASVPQDMVVYRTGFLPQGLEVGDRFTDQAYVSTSALQNFLSEGGASSAGAVMFEIRLPQGTRAAYVAHISSFRHEAEVIINRGSTFSVVGINAGGNFILEVQQ